MDPRTVRHVSAAAASGIVAAVECYVLAEILWSVLSPSGPRLYELTWDRVRECRERMEYRAQVLSTLQMIRRLPENDS
jgi:hypothetical protein